MGRIVVVGSLNLDVVMMVESHPRPGETVLARVHFTNPGGKGANQAVAAARLGNEVYMVGAVGSDAAGDQLVASLESEGVNVINVHRVDAPTGMAAIAVAADGENTIAVGPGANGLLSVGHVDEAIDVIASAAVVLTQLEIPLEVVVRVAEVTDGLLVLNPAPARPLPSELLRRIDVLVPNQSELTLLSESGGSLADQLNALEGPSEVVVTLGGEGAFIGSTGTHIDAIDVTPVDTTAAGDSFCGALADALATGRSISDAVSWAVAASAITVTRRGAQQSLPTRREVEEMLAR